MDSLGRLSYHHYQLEDAHWAENFFTEGDAPEQLLHALTSQQGELLGFNEVLGHIAACFRCWR